MYKAAITIASLLAGIGVFAGVGFLGSGTLMDIARTSDRGVSELSPPALLPASAPELEVPDRSDMNVVYLEEVRVVGQPEKARAHPKRATSKPEAEPAPRELRPCSEWQDVGPRIQKNPDGTVDTRYARLLCWESPDS